jgi:hypothetical protein
MNELLVKAGKAVFWVLVSVGGLALMLWAESDFGDTDVSVAAPDQADRLAAVAELQRAAEHQGYCYGWSLENGAAGTLVSEGSNVGDGLDVDDRGEQCPHWIEVSAVIYYSDPASEQPDEATVAVNGGLPLAVESLARLGLDEEAFLADPGDAVLRAAMALPMLATTARIAPAVPPAAADTTAGPPPDAVGDFWRDRWPLLAVAGSLLALAAAGFGVGWWQRRSEPRQLTVAALVRRERPSVSGKSLVKGQARHRAKARGRGRAKARGRRG